MERSATPENATERVAQNVRLLRKSRGWSADRLIEELAKHGVSWTRGVLVKLETGHREGVSVAELLGLAATFGVEPMLLLHNRLVITISADPA